MKQTTLFALAAASSFACVSASAAIQAFNDDCSEVGVRWSDQTGDYVTSDGSKVTVDTDTTTEVSYYTTYDGTASGTKVVTVLDFDVTFTAATSRPDWQEGAQFQLYVSSSGNVKAMVDDTSSHDVDLGVTNAGLTHVTITKSGNSFSVKVGNNTAATVSPASGSASALTSVGFLGTGTVDNFVGSYGSTATNEGSSDTSSDAAVSVSGNTVTGSFATTVNNNALKFIKVTTSERTYTLRYTDSQVIALPANAVARPPLRHLHLRDAEPELALEGVLDSRYRMPLVVLAHPRVHLGLARPPYAAFDYATTLICLRALHQSELVGFLVKGLRRRAPSEALLEGVQGVVHVPAAVVVHQPCGGFW